LYVGIGDGIQAAEARVPGVLLGKILRMTLDGRPAPGNPFAVPDTSDPRNYVYALGLRNPFAIDVVGGHVLVGDNGPAVDRFLDVAAGGDYLWEGSDWSMGANTAAVFVPSPAPVQMTYIPPAFTALPPSYRGRFAIAMAGLESSVGPANRKGARGIVLVDYDLEARRVREVPRAVFRYRGAGHQSVVGVGVASDGLYIVPLFPDVTGASPILHMTYAPDHPFPYLVLENLSGQDLLAEHGCLGCHSLGDRTLGTTGPPLDQGPLVARLTQRLASSDYAQQSAALDRRQDDPFKLYLDARHAVLAAKGTDRLKLWARYHIEEPRFDNPNALMPNLNISGGEAQSMADYLVGGAQRRASSRWAALRERVVSRRTALVAAVLVFGMFLGAALMAWRGRPARQA
ncbi:MAG: PQQ-dependent sugar dehydrogenase, partial [Gemmatimonadaceae bacterium]